MDRLLFIFEISEAVQILVSFNLCLNGHISDLIANRRLDLARLCPDRLKLLLFRQYGQIRAKSNRLLESMANKIHFELSSK